MFFQNPRYMASRLFFIPRIANAGTSFSPLQCQAWQSYMVTSAHRVEVEVGADRHASAPPSGAAAAAPPEGALYNTTHIISNCDTCLSVIILSLMLNISDNRTEPRHQPTQLRPITIRNIILRRCPARPQQSQPRIRLGRTNN
jgi:hypothetical protein